MAKDLMAPSSHPCPPCAFKLSSLDADEFNPAFRPRCFSQKLAASSCTEDVLLVNADSPPFNAEGPEFFPRHPAFALIKSSWRFGTRDIASLEIVPHANVIAPPKALMVAQALKPWAEAYSDHAANQISKFDSQILRRKLRKLFCERFKYEHLDRSLAALKYLHMLSPNLVVFKKRTPNLCGALAAEVVSFVVMRPHDHDGYPRKVDIFLPGKVADDEYFMHDLAKWLSCNFLKLSNNQKRLPTLEGPPVLPRPVATSTLVEHFDENNGELPHHFRHITRTSAAHIRPSKKQPLSVNQAAKTSNPARIMEPPPIECLESYIKSISEKLRREGKIA